MSTRSIISRQNDDGTVDAIYCHFDGYPSGVGATLQSSYQDPDKISQLIALGDISSLGEEIGEAHDFNRRVEGWCNAYGRDRGETGTEAKRYESIDALWAARRNYGADYAYLFRDGAWVVSRAWSPETPEWTLVSDALAAEDEDEE